MKNVFFILLIVFFGAEKTFASNGKVSIHGTILSYNNKYAKIKTDANNTVKVPVNSLTTPTKGLTLGVSVVQAKVTFKKFNRLNKTPKIKKRKKRLKK